MDFAKAMHDRAAALGKRLVLPEGTEERTLRAAREIADEKIASSVTILGEMGEVEAAAKHVGITLDGITVIDPSKSEWLDEFADRYYHKRRTKGMTRELAHEEMKDPLRFAAMMVDEDYVDSMVAGAHSKTADVLRAGLTIIGIAPGTKTASSCYVMELPDTSWGSDGIMIFADCSVIPTPTAEQLADIAISSAHSCRTFTGVEPVVAFLSYSTKGSGGNKDANILRVQEAVRILTERKPDFVFDGEMQVDAALVPTVTHKKAPGSPIEGKVNTLIFPDLAAGNIGYKLVQRLGNAKAYGPFLQNFAKPISDLSRGCYYEDIVTTAAVTLIQAGEKHY